MRGKRRDAGEFDLVAGDYPRACGGKAVTVRQALADRGLSPRVRGKRDNADRDHD